MFLGDLIGRPMSDQTIFKDFLLYANEAKAKISDESLLCSAFRDLDQFLNFNALSNLDRQKLFNHLAGIGRVIKLPTKAEVNGYFDLVKTIIDSSKKLTSPELAWGGVEPEMYDVLKNVESRLEEILALKVDWEKPGRTPAINRFQKKGIIFIYKMLKENQSDRNIENKWRDLKISEYGKFDKNKIIHENYEFQATPSRLLSNFAKGLGVDLSEQTIVDFIGKQKLAEN